MKPYVKIITVSQLGEIQNNETGKLEPEKWVLLKAIVSNHPKVVTVLDIDSDYFAVDKADIIGHSLAVFDFRVFLTQVMKLSHRLYTLVQEKNMDALYKFPVYKLDTIVTKLDETIGKQEGFMTLSDDYGFIEIKMKNVETGHYRYDFKDGELLLLFEE
ncbi:hypothetical protein [Fructobacillus tropaeoli]|uniref:hypothetical protein n=1 Tax=Fructobacillus tropaeoli TaxID=709323 RepID=UPI002DB1F58C|nr:unnamed protein product [Fructobacillus tropaeoli]